MKIEKLFAVRLEDDSLCEIKFFYNFDDDSIECQLLNDVEFEHIKAIRIQEGCGLNAWKYDIDLENIKQIMIREFNKKSVQAHVDMAERRLLSTDYDE